MLLLIQTSSKLLAFGSRTFWFLIVVLLYIHLIMAFERKYTKNPYEKAFVFRKDPQIYHEKFMTRHLILKIFGGFEV